jgi:biopolymer transport protein ExbD
MGGASIPGGGGKRTVDVDINLVPFIDMMSCLLSFLMLTVVWNRLAKIDIDSPLPKASAAPSEPKDPPKDIAMFVSEKGFAIMVANDDPVKPFTPRPILLGREDGKLPYARLGEQLRALQKALPAKEVDATDEKGRPIKKSFPHNSVIIGARNGIPYEEIVGTMDAARGTCLEDVKAKTKTCIEGIVINMETDSPMVPLVAALEGRPAGG